MKYIIHDEDGKEFEVEETVEESHVEEPTDETHDDLSVLTDDEISALKKLAAVADKIIAMASEEVHDEDEDIDKDKEEEEETSEEVIDTDEEDDKTSKTCDSKKSFNSIETRKKTIDSIDDGEDDVTAAWAKRYNRG